MAYLFWTKRVIKFWTPTATRSSVTTITNCRYEPIANRCNSNVTDATGADGQGIGGFQQYLTDAGMTLDQSPNLLLGTTNEAGEVDPGAFKQAIDAYTTGMGGVTTELRDEYMNPYQAAVQAEIDRTYDVQQAAKGLEAAGSGAFGGSRFAVAQAEIDRNMAQQLALAQAQAFEFAQGAAKENWDDNYKQPKV